MHVVAHMLTHTCRKTIQFPESDPTAALSPPDGCAADSDQRGLAYCKNINMQQTGGRRRWGEARGGVGWRSVKRKQVEKNVERYVHGLQKNSERRRRRENDGGVKRM